MCMVCEREGEREGEENVRSVRLDMHKKELISVKRDLIRVTHTFSTDDAECALGASGHALAHTQTNARARTHTHTHLQMAEESRGRNRDVRTVFGFSYSFLV